MNTKRLAVIKGFTVLALLTMVSVAGAGTALNANQAFSALFSGNNPFIQGNFSYLSKMSQPAVRNGLAAGQSPYAIVLGCSDSRVPPEVVFDKGLGEVFTVRVAGNLIIDHTLEGVSIPDHQLGSIEYALEHLCAPLIVVMGHSKCGAVTAAVNHVLANLDASKPINDPAPVPPALGGTYVNTLVNTLIPSVVTAYNKVGRTNVALLVDEAITQNVKDVAANIKSASAIVAEFVDVGMPAALCPLQADQKARIVGGKYDLATGRVSIIPLP